MDTRGEKDGAAREEPQRQRMGHGSSSPVPDPSSRESLEQPRSDVDLADWDRLSASREVQEALGKKVRALRKERGLSQDALADVCGVSPALLGQLERGNENLRLGAMLAIAQALGITVSDLFIGIA